HRLVLGPFLRDPWNDLQNSLPRGRQYKGRLLGKLFRAKPYEIVRELLAITAVGIPEETVMKTGRLFSEELQFRKKNELLKFDIAVDAERHRHLQQVQQEKPVDGRIGGRTHRRL